MKRILTAICVVLGLLLVLASSHDTVDAQSGAPWSVFYYNNPNWTGNPLFSNTVPTLNFNWNGASPGPNIPGTNWSMTATTDGYFNGATYVFQALADDEVVLMLDNQVIIDTRGRHQVGKWQTVTWGVSPGNHRVEVYYRQFGGTSYLNVNWSISKPGPQPPPPQPNLPHPLPPPSATSVQTEFGNYTPCIQKNIHQSNCFVQNGQWNSPNIGSIQMEPQITIWGNCTPADKDTIWTTNANTNPVQTGSFRCSKTLAGWFPS